MCNKASIAIGLAIVSSCWLQGSNARRIQGKEDLLKQVEIQGGGFEKGNLQKSYISLHDAAKKSKATTPEKTLKATAMLLASIKDALPSSSFETAKFNSSLISRTQQTKAAGGVAASLHQEASEVEASNSTNLLTKLPHVLKAVLAGHFPVHPVNEYVWYCTTMILVMFACSCSCCAVEWLKNVRRHYTAQKSAMKIPNRTNASLITETPKTEAPIKPKPIIEQGRQQYRHKGRVIYEWQQTNSSLMVFTKLPEGMKKESIEVKIWPRHMKIGRIGKIPFLKEELFSSVDVSESHWDILGNGELAVSLRKSQSMEWPCVFRAHHPDN
jgi:hypothetical protein